MSLLARIDAAQLRRHERACPWPTTSGAITTVQPERQAMTKRNPFAKDLPEMTSEAPSSPVETTGAD